MPKDIGKETLKEEPYDIVSDDNMTRIRSISSRMQEYKKMDLKNPVVICSFPGAGMVGSICTGYIIEQLQMHQIAFVDSRFTLPGVIYIGEKLRHPFRLYSNADANLCVVNCEIPITSARGVYSVLDAITKWSLKYNSRELIVLDAFPLDNFPGPDRKVLVLSSDSKAAYGDGFHLLSDLNDKNFTAFVGGVSGGLLSLCISSGISCRGFFVPSYSRIPDPEGAALLIESVNSTHRSSVDINTQQLRKEGERIRRRMEELAKIMLSPDVLREKSEHVGDRMYA
jgi:uncharacterized protein